MSIIHIVPHTHWDREWYQPFQVFRIRLVHLIDRLLEILGSDPDFSHFTLDGQAIVLEDYLAIRPHRRAELEGHVRAGRLLIGPWYVLPDEFLVSPESLVRNLLRGRQVCATFGASMPVGYIPDPFGHIGQMPQILRGFQLETACVERGLADQPCELWWESPDGSRVLLAGLREGYDNAARMPTTQPAFDEFVRQRREALTPHARSTHLLLLNGTDHHEAQPEVPAMIRASQLQDDLRLSSLPAYIEAVAREVEARRLDLPVVRGELRSSKRHHLLPGVLSSRMWIKQRNQACETLLERWAEPFAAWAEGISTDAPDRAIWTGHLAAPRLRRPGDLLAEAWRLLLECQPHDSICGSSIDQVHAEMRPRFDQVEQIGEEITRQSLAALAGAVDTAASCPPPARAAVVVFNAAGVPQSGLALASLELPAGLDPFEVRDENGAGIPFRILSRRTRELADLTLDRDGLLGMLALVDKGRVLGLAIQAAALVPQGDEMTIDVIVSESGDPDPQALSTALPGLERWSEGRPLAVYRLRAHFATQVEVELLARDVPVRGYRTYALHPANALPSPAELDGGTSIENGLLRVEIDRHARLALTDLRRGTIYADVLRMVDVADRGDLYTFCPLEDDRPIDRPAGPIEVRRSQDACGKTLECVQTYRLPRALAADRRSRSAETVDVPIRTRLTLAPDADRLDIEVTLDNLVEDHRLQAVFRLPGAQSEGLYGGHFEIVRRPSGARAGGEGWIEEPPLEQPMHHFVAAGDGSCAMVVGARGLTEASVALQGEFAVTLLRCVGWLSRDDLATRKGGAGPGVPTPEAQCPGRHRFELCLIPAPEGQPLPIAQAEAYQTPLRAVGTDLHDGDLPSTGSFTATEPPAFQVTAVKAAEDGRGVIVRGVLLDDGEARVRFVFQRPLRTARRARLDESDLEDIPLEPGNATSISARAWEIVTVRAEFA